MLFLYKRKKYKITPVRLLIITLKVLISLSVEICMLLQKVSPFFQDVKLGKNKPPLGNFFGMLSHIHAESRKNVKHFFKGTLKNNGMQHSDNAKRLFLKTSNTICTWVGKFQTTSYV